MNEPGGELGNGDPPFLHETNIFAAGTNPSSLKDFVSSRMRRGGDMYKSNWYVVECSGKNVEDTIFFTMEIVSVGRNLASIQQPSGKHIFSCVGRQLQDKLNNRARISPYYEQPSTKNMCTVSLRGTSS